MNLTVHKDDEGLVPIYSVHSGEKRIARILTVNEPESFASLFASAPALLEACKDMVGLFFMCGTGIHAAGGVIDSINTAKDKAIAAIALAEEK